jgi:hypothetical protein
MKFVRRAKDKHRSKPIYVYQNRRYMTRKDFEYLCFNGVFEYEKLPKGRYYIPIDNIEEAITNHVKHKVQKWLSSPLQGYTKANWKSGTTVTRIRHFHMLRQLTQCLRQNAYFLNGIRRLRRRVRKDSDDNWSYGDCGWRLTQKTYYKNCRCHLCEDWNGCGSTKTTKCFSYFCEVCNTEKALPKHLKRSYN